MTITSFRNNIILLTVGLYLVFNYGFMQVRLPPGAGTGIPVGEVVLLFSLLLIHYPTTLPKLSAIISLVPFILWWGVGFFRAVEGFDQYGFWAFRDATHVIESLFIILGFSFAQKPETLNSFFKWLPMILLAGFIYALGYPFAKTLQAFSPKIVAGAGHVVPIFFTYTNSAMVLLLGASFLILFRPKLVISKYTMSFVLLFILGYTVFLMQARTIYLQIIAIVALLFVYRREQSAKMVFGLVVLLIVLIAIPFLELQITGRLGQKASFEFFVNHFLAIGGVKNVGVEGSAQGVAQRLDWWMNLYRRWTVNWENFIIGLGYGFPLIKFSIGHSVREPHNSYISIIARIGMIGICAWAWMHVLLLRIWRKAYRLCSELNWREGENRLLLLLIFFILIWILSIGEDGFEKPYNAIPYYFFWGVVLRFFAHLSNGQLGPPVRTPQLES